MNCVQHHFVFPPPSGKYSTGTCKKCGEKRVGGNSVQAVMELSTGKDFAWSQWQGSEAERLEVINMLNQVD